MNSYTVKNEKEAWKKANELMPCDYMHDSDRSRRAGYDIYFSTCDSVIAWISDLGNRLEVNLPKGESINIWIDEEAAAEEESEKEEEEVKKAVQATHSVKKIKVSALYNPTVCQRITVSIMDGIHAQNEDEKIVFEALKRKQIGIEFEIIERYCDCVHLPWGTISSAKSTFIEYGNSGNGHFIVEAYVSARIGSEIEFLQNCADLLSIEYAKSKL